MVIIFVLALVSTASLGFYSGYKSAESKLNRIQMCNMRYNKRLSADKQYLYVVCVEGDPAQ